MLNTKIILSKHNFLFNREIGLPLIGWIVFLSAASVYCVIYTQLVVLSPVNFINSFWWTLQQYAVWLFITPILFFCLQRIHNLQKHSFLQSYSLMVIVALLVVLLLHGLMNANKEYQLIIANLVNIFPSQLSILTLLILLWHVFFRITNRQQDHVIKSENYADKVRVIKGNSEVWITWTSVDVISAAGNYMELGCGAEKYLLRITLKELEQQLPPQGFIRVHRSHIVNISSIRKIGSQTAGNGFIELRNDQSIPLSKGYKKVLTSISLVPDSSQ